MIGQSHIMVIDIHLEEFGQNIQISLFFSDVMTDFFCAYLCWCVCVCVCMCVCVHVCLFACSKVSPCVLDKGIDVSSGPEDTVNRITVVWRELRQRDRGQYQIPWPILCPVVHTKDNKHRGNRGYCSLFIIATTHTQTVTTTRKWLQRKWRKKQNKISFSYWNPRISTNYMQGILLYYPPLSHAVLYVIIDRQIF